MTTTIISFIVSTILPLLLIIAVLAYWLYDNKRTRKMLNEQSESEHKWAEETINAFFEKVHNTKGWYLVVILWYDTHDTTSYVIKGNSGIDAIDQQLIFLENSNTAKRGDLNKKFAITNVIRL